MDLRTTEFAYGIIPFYKNETGGVEILLIQHSEGKWGFPKGHPEENETPLITAQREFSEETGISDFELLDELIFIEEYTHTKDGYPRNKIVKYAPAIVFSKELSVQAEEVREAVWVDIKTAKNTVSLTKNRREILEQALSYISNKKL